MQPVAIALGLVVAQFWICLWLARDWHGLRSLLKKLIRPLLVFTGGILPLAVFIASTKIGLVKDTLYWNVAGIPFTGSQLLFTLILTTLALIFLPGRSSGSPLGRFIRKYHLLPVTLYLVTVWFWGNTPLLRHFFSLELAPPSFQPFPYSDARFLDLGGISILKGYGIYFFGYTDKPLSMIHMAFLHLFAGYDYQAMLWLQMFVLALIPVALYYFGEHYLNPAFGIFISLVLIFRQQNAIVLASRISSVNPKLFMSEELTLLGMALLAWLAFLWIQKRKIWLAWLCGGCIGAASLLRINPLFLFPAMVLVVAPAFWKLGKKFLSGHLLAYTMAFLIIFIPWVISGVNPEGIPWLQIKIEDVIRTRYINSNSYQHDQPTLGLTGSDLGAARLEKIAFSGDQPIGFQRLNRENNSGFSSIDSQLVFTTKYQNAGDLVSRFLDHVLHNFATSALSLPTLFYENLDTLSQEAYWMDQGGWQGDLPPFQTRLVFLNLLLLAVGLAMGWMYHRWAGMVPLVIFLAYSISLGAAMNSGGRYLVPMDWTVHFYYGLAIVGFMQFVNNGFHVSDINLPTPLDNNRNAFFYDRFATCASLAGIIFLAALIPVANFVLPRVLSKTPDQQPQESALEYISSQEGPAVSIVPGQILYPYYDLYEDGQFSFDFLTMQGATHYVINARNMAAFDLKGGEEAFLGLNADAQGYQQLVSVYLWRDAQVIPVWKIQP